MVNYAGIRIDGIDARTNLQGFCVIYDQFKPRDLKGNQTASQILLSLTSRKIWDYESFSNILIKMATTGEYIPARHQPDYINMGTKPNSLGETADKLEALTIEKTKEHARTFLVDVDKELLLLSEQITVGTYNEVAVFWDTPFLREQYCKRSTSIHTHDPRNISGTSDAELKSFLENINTSTEIYSLSGLHFSNPDFEVFLKDGQQTCMIVGWRGAKMMILKTSATQRDIPKEIIQNQIERMEKDFISRRLTFQSQMAHMKRICSTFGLILYVVPPGNMDLAKRVPLIN